MDLKRVFNIDVSVCPKCSGEARMIVSIGDQRIIDKIPSLGVNGASMHPSLDHLMKKGALLPPPELLPTMRASTDSDWFA
jgi:hypothetical protein